MKLDINITGGDNALRDIIRAVGPQSRHLLLSSAAEGVWTLCRSHLAAVAARRHRTAMRLGAQDTGHFTKGIRAMTFHASATDATVVIPIAGLSRAWHDLDIRPKKAGKLTIPINAISYGHRVKELKGRGWRFFRAGNALFGTRGKGEKRETLPLYALKDRVRQAQEPELLPTPHEIARTAETSMGRYISHILKKGHMA